MVAVVNGRPFQRVRAGSKRECRSGAAYLAWKTLMREDQDKVSVTVSPLLPGTEPV